MSVVSRTLKRSLAAFALSYSRRHTAQAFVPRWQREQNVRLFSSFQAPVPPQSKGEAVYKDIDVTKEIHSSSQAGIRNKLPDGVFVVNGASRGIGLQFVKALIASTEVSDME